MSFMDTLTLQQYTREVEEDLASIGTQFGSNCASSSGDIANEISNMLQSFVGEEAHPGKCLLLLGLSI